MGGIVRVEPSLTTCVGRKPDDMEIRTYRFRTNLSVKVLDFVQSGGAGA